MRRSLVVAAAALVVAVAFAGAVMLLVTPTVDDAPSKPTTRGEPRFARLEGFESGVYPYISPEPAFPGYGPMNLLVRGNLSQVLEELQDPSDGTWNTTSNGTAHVDPGDVAPGDVHVGEGNVVWGEAPGSKRYACVHDGGEPGCTWVLPTLQLHDGTYFGHRVHVRLYESPRANEPWVAMQAHSEYLDWFTLRHEVDGVEAAQRHVEDEFMGEPGVEVHRVFLGNEEPYDADGWATVVELALALPLAGLAWTPFLSAWERLEPTDRRRLRRLGERVTPRHALLASTILAIVLGVRALGILLERYAALLSMHAIAALLYPVMALGLPLATVAIARGLQRRMDAGVTASAALGLAFLVDYAALGVTTLPIGIVLQRVGVVVALGLVAAGSTERAARDARWNPLLVSGLVLWVGLLGATLLGWV